ncbi:M56 family metallopeptidase [Rhodopirellula sp. P2]|uniref:M56 family metallopeptidase n=1 Tax=Rhodopirellula sp. P2 TaxID=2127060 RepID=UPI0023681A3C|nr:M56 family metallopeptidase [Rhodopirellula sp. P2]WDQ15567.1 M56 family metallopeptidase [Rhodopirellula sp. P2]
MDWRFAFEVGSTLCVQVTVVIAATFLLQRLTDDARSACRLSTAGFLCVIGLVAAAFALPHRRLLHFPTGMSREAILGFSVWQGRIAMVLAAVWAAGVLASLFRRMTNCIRLLRFLRKACRQIDATAMLARSEITSQPPDGLSILISDLAPGPFCWQLHRPVIVLPSFLLDEEQATLKHVLLHELEHLRTQHPMQHFLQGVCSTLFWFHPLVWSAASNAELIREYLCDEAAARTAGKFGDYLRTLARVAECCSSVPRSDAPQGTLAFGNHPSALVQRSKRLVKAASHQAQPSKWHSTAALSALLICTAMVQQLWLPTNAMASQRSDWSPWPAWTANALHQFDVNVRDFERFEERVQMHELLQSTN